MANFLSIEIFLLFSYKNSKAIVIMSIKINKLRSPFASPSNSKSSVSTGASRRHTLSSGPESIHVPVMFADGHATFLPVFKLKTLTPFSNFRIWLSSQIQASYTFTRISSVWVRHNTTLTRIRGLPQQGKRGAGRSCNRSAVSVEMGCLPLSQHQPPAQPSWDLAWLKQDHGQITLLPWVYGGPYSASA